MRWSGGSTSAVFALTRTGAHIDAGVIGAYDPGANHEGARHEKTRRTFGRIIDAGVLRQPVAAQPD